MSVSTLPQVVSETPIFEDQPRFKGAPLVCLKKNKMAFATEDDLSAFMAKYAPRESYVSLPCHACKHFHAY